MRRLTLLLALLGTLLIPAAASALTPAELHGLGATSCPNLESDFRCLAVTVPLDHFDAANPATLRILAAIHPATRRPSKGLLITLVGGPGASGITDGPGQLRFWSPAVLAAYDFVYLDQRGVAESSGIYCPNAVVAARRAEGRPDFDLARVDRRFAAACVREADAPELLPFLGTRQAAEDLEAVRQALGAPRTVLYGESYGTQLAAAYARQHPEGLSGLILDGVVDTTLTPTAFWRSAARGFEGVLDETFATCSRRPRCRDDFPRSAAATYDALDRQLARAPLRVTGGTGWLTRAMLHTYIGSVLYSPSGRASLLHDLAAYARGDVGPLVEGAWIAEGVDPTTWGLFNTGISYASYFGIQCADGGYYAGTPTERAAAWQADGAAVGADLPRIGATIFDNDLSCAWWPGSPGPHAPPAPLVLPGIPAIVLTATGDPITPHWQGAAVVRSLAEGRLIRTLGGSHVTLSADAPCRYAPVAALLLHDRLPAGTTTCRGLMVPTYR